MPASLTYQFGRYVLDPSRRLLTRDGEPVALTARAFDVLLALVEGRGETLEKDELLRRVWPDTVVEEGNLSQQVFTIRRLLAASGGEHYIVTVPRRGYRFVADVTESPDEGAARTPPAVEDRVAIVRLEIPLSGELALAPSSALAVSPDGSCVVFALCIAGVTRLFRRELGEFGVTEVAGTEGASNPFVSPDGEWIGFQEGRRLRKVPRAGGPPETLCEVGELRGATWTISGRIVFAPAATSGLWCVDATGGRPVPLTVVDHDGGERTHRWPHALHDGRGVMFTVGHAGAASFDEASLAVVQFDGESHRLVLGHATDGRVTASGHAVWARGGALFAAPFDLEAMRIEAAGRQVQRGVASAATGVAHFAVSASGTLVHVPGDAQTLRHSLVAVDRSGTVLGDYASAEGLEEPRLSGTGRTVLLSQRGRRADVWLHDPVRGTMTRITFEGENFAGIWGPSEGEVTFSSARDGGSSDLYVVRPDRPAPPELLVASEFDKAPGSWTPDGQLLLFTEYHPETGADIWMLDRHRERATPFVRTAFNEYAPACSPDGAHVAYTSDESGRPEIYVVSFPEAIGKRQLSIDGGVEPVWAHDGRELFYRSGDRLMRVDMTRGVADPGIPTTLFEGKYQAGTVTVANYDISPDGNTFFMVRPHVVPPPTALFVTLGWFSELP